MIFREELDAVEIVNSGLGFAQSILVDVRRVKQRALLETFFTEKNNKGIQLLTAAAPGDPDLERRIGTQVGHDLLADRPEIGRVSEHSADLYGQVAQDVGEHAGIMKQAFLKRGKTTK